ncbi:serine hydrolase domain-containing protein [Cellulomonas soli]|uniref:serine hydrolase domain-containing protein n=1 Tax=Cellulomonas soli TaxID=931535 RepID=UPI003F84AA14
MSAARHADDLHEHLESLRATARVPGLGVATVAPDGVHVLAAGVADARTGRPVGDGTAFHACSMSKAVTAVAVMRLVQQGIPDLSEDVDASLRGWSLPRVGEAAGQRVTLAHLLAHESGVVDPDGSFAPTAGPAPSTVEVLRGSVVGQQGAVVASRRPGTGFEYADAGYCIVERVVADVTGRPFADAVRELVLDPLGLTGSSFWDGAPGSPTPGDGEPSAGHDASGVTVPGTRVHYPGSAAAGLWSTPRDLAVLLADLMPAWAGQADGTLLTVRSAQELLVTGSEATVGRGVFLPSLDGTVCVQSHGWGVGFQCLLRAYPGRGEAVVVMIDADPGIPQGESLVGQVVEAWATARGLPS